MAKLTIEIKREGAKCGKCKIKIRDKDDYYYCPIFKKDVGAWGNACLRLSECIAAEIKEVSNDRRN